MGGFDNLYSFISNRVLPRNNSDDGSNKENCNFGNHTHHRRSNSASALLPKETIQQLYPCEDRHSFNPHYQHNLHSTSPSYSTPPSLSSSPTNSSPSSTTSSSSSHSLSQAGYKPYYQNHPSASKRSSQSARQQQQKQRQQHQQHSRNNSYNRQQTRSQNQYQRNYANQQYLEALDDDLVVGYDGQRIFYESGASSMARVHPNGSPSYSSFPSSVSSTFGGRHHLQRQQQQQPSHISWSENERTSSPASRSLSAAAAAAARSQHASAPGENYNNNYIQNGQSSSSLLPRISEATAVMSVHDEQDETVVVENDGAGLGPRNLTSKSSSDARMTARLSLMRIVQCDIRNDDWCSQQSGQWTSHYAKTRSIGIKSDGRRTGRL
ncbi:hypothetical protein BGX27_011307 [Mortierella sp. AM989]|nr:hypothetical protein BGX27_011307 [Mortierella sp. AM989]